MRKLAQNTNIHGTLMLRASSDFIDDFNFVQADIA